MILASYNLPASSQINIMASVGNPYPGELYDTFKDCSQPICSIYCPEFCYSFLPPPPSDDDPGDAFSPLIIAIIGVLASGLLLVSYYIILSRYCRRRNDGNSRTETAAGIQNQETGDENLQIPANGLDESLIKTITVCKYQKNDGFIEGSDCAVCLSEFQENESLRLLPKCSHAFHLPCIDTWLKSHSNCPLCRANVVPPTELSSSDLLEVHRPSDMTVVMVDNQESCELQVVVNLGNAEEEDESVEQLRRSISFWCHHLLISDILKMDEDDLECSSNKCCSVVDEAGKSSIISTSH